METITVALVIAVITLVMGEASKILKLDTKYIPLQNLLIGLVSIIVCLVFKVENLGILETIITCVLASMGAGGLYDLKKLNK